MEKAIEENQSKKIIYFGNPDFYFTAFWGIVILDLAIESFATGAVTLLVAIPIAIIGIIISIIRWRKISIRQRIFALILLASVLIGIYLLLPGL